MSKQSRVRGSKEITQKSMKMRTEYTETCGKQGRRQIYDTKCPQQERGKGHCSKFLPSRSQQKQKQQNDKATQSKTGKQQRKVNETKAGLKKTKLTKDIL